MKFDTKKTLKISLAFAWISVLANVMDTATPLVLTNQFDFDYTSKGVVMAIDNILGLFMLPLFGWLSDHCRSKHGKRTPFILVGSLGAIICWALAGFAILFDMKVPFVACLAAALAFIATARPASLALLPDVTCMRERRKANAITQIVSIVFTLIGVGICAIGAFYWSYFVSAAIMLVLWILFVRKVNENEMVRQFAKDYPTEAGKQLTEEEERNLELDIDPDDFVPCTLPKEMVTTVGKETGEVVYERIIKRSKRGRAKFFLLACIFFFYMAFNGLTSSLSNYAVEVLQLKGSSFVLPQLLCMVAACIVAVPSTKITKRLGRKNSLILGLILMLLAFILAGNQTGLTTMMLCAFLIAGVGYSITLVNFYPYFLELNAHDSIGTSTGTFNMAMMSAMIITPILTGVLSDRLFIGILFPYCAAALAFSLAALFFVPQHINYVE